jgi:hypothetical protein
LLSLCFALMPSLCSARPAARTLPCSLCSLTLLSHPVLSPCSPCSLARLTLLSHPAPAHSAPSARPSALTLLCAALLCSVLRCSHSALLTLTLLFSISRPLTLLLSLSLALTLSLKDCSHYLNSAATVAARMSACTSTMLDAHTTLRETVLHMLHSCCCCCCYCLDTRYTQLQLQL